MNLIYKKDHIKIYKEIIFRKLATQILATTIQMKELQLEISQKTIEQRHSFKICITSQTYTETTSCKIVNTIFTTISQMKRNNIHI